MDYLFKLETIAEIDFKIDVKKPPRSAQWECSIAFDGKSMADFNADMCLFLEQWEQERDDVRSYGSTQKTYSKWKERTLSYYAATSVECVEPEELDEATRIEKRNEYLRKAFGSPENE